MSIHADYTRFDNPGVMSISANPFHYVKEATDAVFNPDGAGKTPGVGGPAADPSKLIPSPTGLGYYDPTTGTSYTDASGQSPIASQNVAQQIAQQQGVQNQDLANAMRGGQMLQQGFQGETNLANSLNNTISNPNATSVAGGQLTQGENQNVLGQMGQAAGVGGQGGAAARLMATQNIGNINAQTNQAKGLQRAQETAQAQQNLAGVLNAQASQGQQYSGQNQSAAHGAATNAMEGATGNQGQTKDAQNKDNAAYNGLLNKGLSALAL
jgi:hypothetical protein